jgi:hypothetical protein
MRYGDGLREQLEVGAEQFLFIPAGVPQLPSNPSDDEACVAVLARTDPNESRKASSCWDEQGRRPTTAASAMSDESPHSQEVRDDKHRPDNEHRRAEDRTDRADRR